MCYTYRCVWPRYRKIHLYGEGTLGQPQAKELVYFDTDFGVRFGLLTCFDIIFEDPGVVLAKEYNITHFIFPTAWFSEMPFLTGKFYFSYQKQSLYVLCIVRSTELALRTVLQCVVIFNLSYDYLYTYKKHILFIERSQFKKTHVFGQ